MSDADWSEGDLLDADYGELRNEILQLSILVKSYRDLCKELRRSIKRREDEIESMARIIACQHQRLKLRRRV
jgi:hypothetical protein